MFLLFRQFDDSFCSFRPNTMKPWACAPAAAHKSSQTPGCPGMSCLWLQALNAYGEGVSLIFPQPSEKEPDSFVCSQDIQVKQITKMPD